MMFNFRICGSLILFALIVRGSVAWLGYSDLAADPDSYSRLAVTWAATGTFGFEGESGVSATAFRPPLYPWLLSWFVDDAEVSQVAVAILHVLLGCATVVLTYAIGSQLQLRSATIAAIAVTLDPILLRQSQLVMTETLATFLAVLAWWLWLIAYSTKSFSHCDAIQREAAHRAATSRSATQWIAVIGLGLVLGISILARPTAAPLALMCAIAALFIGCTCWKRRVNDCVLICLGVLVCIVPWMLRNYSELGKPIWATTHGGYTLLLANNPPLYRHFIKNGPSRAWEAEEFQEAWSVRVSLEDEPLTEIGQDQLAYRAALSTIARMPTVFVASCFYRVGWLWALWPYDGSFGVTEVLIAVWYTFVFGLAYVSLKQLWRKRALRDWLFGLLVIVSLTAIHSIFWSNMRMRAPAMPCIMLLAVAVLPTGRLRSAEED